MTLQLLNDGSLKCRVKAADVIASLVRRVSKELLSEQFLQFGLKWMGSLDNSEGSDSSASSRSLVIAGVQVCSLLVQHRADIMKRQAATLFLLARTALLRYLHCRPADLLLEAPRKEVGEEEQVEVAQEKAEEEGIAGSGEGADWAVLYQVLLLLERCLTHLGPAAELACVDPGDLSSDTSPPPLMLLVLEALLFPHAWVRAVCCRLLLLYLSQRDVTRLTSDAISASNLPSFELLTRPNGLYQLGRRLCVCLSQAGQATGALVEAASAAAVFTVRAMFRQTEGDGAAWLMQRLRGVGTDSQRTGPRRLLVLRLYLLLLREEQDPLFWTRFSHHLVEVASRACLSVQPAQGGLLDSSSPEPQQQQQQQQVAEEVLALVEQRVGSQQFLGVLAAVQRRLQQAKASRKQQLAAEAVTDPRAFAAKKVERQQQKKGARKRRNLRFDATKGTNKRPRKN